MQEYNKAMRRNSTEFDIKYVRVATSTGTELVDVTHLINYVEIFESIDSPFITLNINLTDATGLSSLLPLVGEEFIEVDIRSKDQVSGLIGQTFFIYKVSDRINVSDRASTFTLNCISIAAVSDLNIKLSKAYSGLPSEIVKQICNESLILNKRLSVTESKYTLSYISNYWSPLRNMEYICNRAISKESGSASYVFYESKSSFWFVPIESLVSKDPVQSFFYSVNTHDVPLDQPNQIQA